MARKQSKSDEKSDEIVANQIEVQWQEPRPAP